MPPPPWPPDYRIACYQGPYPIRDLEAARRVLITMLSAPAFSNTLEMIKPRIGIASCYGPAQSPPPIPSKEKEQNWYTPPQYKSPPKVNHNNGSHGVCPQPHFHSTPLRGNPTSQNQHTVVRANLSNTSLDSGFLGESSFSSSHTDLGDSFNGSKGNKSCSPQSASLSAISAQANNLSLSPQENRVNYSQTPMKRKSEPTIFDTPNVNNLKKPKFVNQANFATIPSSNIDGSCVKTERLYKCDFCQFNSHTQQEMQTHLTSAKHFSGSLYNANISPNGVKLLSIEKMLAVKNPYSMTKTLVVACPDCHELFEDIFMCALHHKYTHGSVNGCYAICPVIRHETIPISRSPKCSVCDQVYDKHRDLHLHWNKEPEHHPLKDVQAASSSIFTLFICPYCSKIFYNNFLACKTHVLEHPKNSDRFALEIKHVMQPRRNLEIPPFNTTKTDGLKLELQILTNMSKFYKNEMSGAKSKAKGLRARIDTLNNLLYGN